VWPLYAAHLDRDRGIPAQLPLAAPVAASGWTIDPVPMTDWRPRYEGAVASVFQTYRRDGRVVALWLGYYPQQRQGSELVTSTNIMVVQKHPVWSNMGESERSEDLGKGAFEIRETRLRSPVQRLLVWDWSRIAGRDLTNPYLAKVLFARDRLLDRGDEAAAIILATPYEEQTAAAEDTLRSFARAMAPSIDAALAEVGSRARPAGP
jgi:EpsI family protein